MLLREIGLSLLESFRQDLDRLRRLHQSAPACCVFSIHPLSLLLLLLLLTRQLQMLVLTPPLLRPQLLRLCMCARGEALPS